MVSWRISAHADLRQLIKSSLKDDLVGFFVVHDQGWPTDIQWDSYQVIDLAMVNILHVASSISHEKGGTMTQLSIVKCSQQPLPPEC